MYLNQVCIGNLNDKSDYIRSLQAITVVVDDALSLQAITVFVDDTITILMMRVMNIY